MTQAAVYCRVSTKDQRDHGTSLESQREAGFRKAAELGWTIPQECIVEEDWSGTDLHRRGLIRLVDLGKGGKAQAVIMYTLDRLYRPENPGDEWQVFLLLKQLQDAGLEVVWVDSSVPVQGPYASVVTLLKSLGAGDERRAILERTMRGRRRKAEQGKVVNPHNLPWWLVCDRESGQVQVDQERAQVYRLAVALLLDEGLSLRGVCRRLEELGVRTPQGGRRWQATTLRAWLRHPAAYGEFFQFRYQQAEPQRRHRAVGRRRKSSRKFTPPETWVTTMVPAVIDRRLWEAVQRRLDQNKALAPRRTQRHYLVRGLAYCGRCGGRLVGVARRSGGRELRYYHCWRNHLAHAPISGEPCPSGFVRAEALEGEVWAALERLLLHPELLVEELRRRREAGSATRTGFEDRIRACRRRLQAIAGEEDRLLEAWNKKLFPEDLIEAKAAALAREKEALRAEALDLERRLAALDLTDQQEADVLAFAQRVRLGLDHLTEQEREALVRLLVERITVVDGSATVQVVVPIHGSYNGDGTSGDVHLCTNPPQTLSRKL